MRILHKKPLVMVILVLSNVNKMNIMILLIRNVVIRTATQSRALAPRSGSVMWSWMTIVILQPLKRYVIIKTKVYLSMEVNNNVKAVIHFLKYFKLMIGMTKWLVLNSQVKYGCLMDGINHQMPLLSQLRIQMMWIYWLMVH